MKPCLYHRLLGASEPVRGAPGAVAEVWAFVPAKNMPGRSIGKDCRSRAPQFHVSLRLPLGLDELPDCELGIIATKATQVDDSIAPVGHRFDKGAIISAQTVLGCEEIIAAHTRGYVIGAQPS